MQNENNNHKTIVTLSALTLLAVVAQFFGMKYYVADAIEANEARKVGGAANYETLKQLYSSAGFSAAQKQQLESALAQMNGQQPTTSTDTSGQEEFPSGKLTAEQLAAMMKDTYVMGEKNAQITIIEYSDPECPFCIRHYNDKTIETVMNTYKGNVNHIVKAVQGVNHPGTEYKSLALLCAGKLGGEDAYYEMYDKILGQSTPEAPIAVSAVPGLAKEIGLNATKFSTCVDTKELASVYAANWQEALSLNSGGTPGNLIINNETGEWKLVAGAYPADTFNQIIAAWIK